MTLLSVQENAEIPAAFNTAITASQAFRSFCNPVALKADIFLGSVYWSLAYLQLDATAA